MSRPMTVRVICDECSIDLEGEFIEMELFGSLVFNPTTKSQSQAYKCPTCEHHVSVIIEVQNG